METYRVKYNRLGYLIYSGGELIYGAGNSPLDSQVVVSRGGLGLETIREYAERSAFDLAFARGMKKGGFLIKLRKGGEAEIARRYAFNGCVF